MTGAARGGQERELSRWDLEDWREALLDIPLDEQVYRDRLQIDRLDEIERLWNWWSDEDRPRDDVTAATAGYLGFFLLTLVAMHCSDQVRFQGAVPHNVTIAGWDLDDLCGPLVKDPAVRQVIERLYAPAAAEGAPAAAGEEAPDPVEHWEDVDFTSLEFHRTGTTSIILSGWTKRELGNRRLKFALKLLIFPYQVISAITSATREYRDRYRLTVGEVGEVSHLVPVWVSHDSWVKMDFVEGFTLAEVLERAAAASGPPPKREILRRVDLERLELLGTALLEAMEELERHDRHHGDLSPSNVIVEHLDTRGTVRLRLIDLGVNYLFRRSVGGLLQGDAAYVAPEVRLDGKSSRLSDVYSTGMLLTAIAGIPPNADGTVPDQFYAASVGLARLIEDLTDADPERRLLVSGVKSGPRWIPRIKELFGRELEVAQVASRTERVEGFLQVLKRLTPGEGQVARQRQIMEVRARQAKGDSRSFHLRQSRWLNRWAWVSSWFLWATFALVVMWWARDLGIDWQAKFVEMLNNLLGRDQEGIVLLDDVRADDYPIPDPWGNLAVRLIAFTFVLAGAKWYLNILAELSPRSQLRRRGRRRALTLTCEIAIRAAAVLPSVYVAVPTLVQRDWWPLFSAIGITTLAVVNATCLMFARATFRSAREEQMSTVPAGEVSSLEKFAPWVPTSCMYGAFVWTIGTLIMFGVLQDELLYASSVAFVNIGVFYIIKCGTEAPYVRVGLTRAILAAERLDHLESLHRKQIPVARAPERAPARSESGPRTG
ncbi:protein kinase domain-containing protein [Glycomyces harbinensis]|uniref:protein kinase domain-containing protein n=1 Tax=Glycomyces harbinensis TaxID=58114 RepID=UPI000B834BF8|nr:protein kinase [Glycomyces harbinensis]